MNVRQVAFLLFASVGLWSISASLDAQQLQIKGPKSNTAVLSGASYGPVTPEDTLWRIASRYRQNKNLSVYQVMQAIYQLNPAAFDDENFNHLIDGSMLKLPSERYIARIDTKQAQMKAEQDDSAWQAFSKGETDKVAVAKPQEAASKDDLTETKKLIEDKLTALDAEQNRQFMAIRQQFAESIDSVQTLLNENRKLVDRLDVVDTEISSLRGRVDEELQVQMDQMLALQNELLAISKEAEAQRKAEMESSGFAWLTDPLFLIFLSALFTISLLGGLAMWLIRRNRPENPSEPILDENHAAVLEQSDEMDDLADALTNELSEELSDDDDDDLFADDDILDDVLSDELEESLDSAIDEEFEAFDDLGDESLDPIVEAPSDESANAEDLVAQEDLDNLFDEEDLLAEIDDDLGDIGAESDTEINSDDDSDVDTTPDPESPEQSAEVDVELSEDDIVDSVKGELEETSEPPSDVAVPSEELKAPIPSSDIDDEPDKPEISIDELLESPTEEEAPDSIISDDPDLMNEDMLQNIDKEINSQNEQLDNIADELLNEIEQLEQMGGMLDEDLDDEPLMSDDEAGNESQMGIQELDSLSENIDDADESDIDSVLAPDGDGEEIDIADELFDSFEEESDESEQATEQSTPVDEDAVDIVDVFGEVEEASQTEEDAEPQNVDEQDAVDTDEELLTQDSIEDTSVESLSADELLAELEGDIADANSPELDSPEIDSPELDSLELDSAEVDSAVVDSPEVAQDGDELEVNTQSLEEVAEQISSDENSSEEVLTQNSETAVDDDVSSGGLEDTDLSNNDLAIDEQVNEDTATDAQEIDSEALETSSDGVDKNSEDFQQIDPETEGTALDKDDAAVTENNALEEQSEDQIAEDNDELIVEQEGADNEINADSEAVEDLDKALEDFEQEVLSEATSFDVELEDEEHAGDDIDDVQLEEIIPPEKDDDIEKVLSDFDEDIPSIGDIDSLSGNESDGFDDSDLDEALKAFDEDFLTDQNDLSVDTSSSAKQSNVELDDLPGLGDWLSSDDAEESSSLDELENTSFDDLLDSIDSTDDSDKASDSEIEKKSAQHESGLDFDALLNDIDDDPGKTNENQQSVDTSEDDFLDVDDLINESIEAEGNLDIDKELNLSAAFESYKGFGDVGEVDVDGDHGIGAKLDLAQAYIETDDTTSAKELLEEVLQKGDETQQEEAKELLKKLS